MQKKPINYTNRDFESIKKDLIEHAKRYYPDTFKDFSEASFGSMLLDMVSYVGDNLSFYLDYQANETFMDSAIEFRNIQRMARAKGLKASLAPSSFGNVALYLVVPASATGLGPDTNYIPSLKKAVFGSKGGGSFTLSDEVRFDLSSNEIRAAQINDTSGIPSSYAIKAYGKVISGVYSQEQHYVDDFVRFRQVKLKNRNISEIISVLDSQGNEYHEVDHLSQNIIYKTIPNYDSNTQTISNILKPFAVSRRFTVEKDDTGSIYLQFGYGSSEEEYSNSLVEPSKAAIQLYGKEYSTDRSFDPSSLLSTDKFGISPANTTLVVKYRMNSNNTINASVDSVTNVISSDFVFPNESLIVESVKNTVKSSLEVTNEETIVGSLVATTNDELRNRSFSHYAAQNRAVTKSDIEAVVYSMPTKFGSIKRATAIHDSDSFRRNINLYVLSQDQDGKLTTASTTLKENLKVWLNNYRMMTDTIDILDGKCVNFSLDFTVIGDSNTPKHTIYSDVVSVLKNKFKEPNIMGEPLNISELYALINKNVKGVVDTVSIKVLPKVGNTARDATLPIKSYSQSSYNFDLYLSPDGRTLYSPENVCLEIRNPTYDIKGKVI